jgi:hypothetical protein
MSDTLAGSTSKAHGSAAGATCIVPYQESRRTLAATPGPTSPVPYQQSHRL